MVLEREIREMAFIPRWSIVRTNRQQFLAEHTFFVTMYANDIGVWLGLDAAHQAALLQMALWHDMEEIFSGDLPGPCKRAGMGEGRAVWDAKLSSWLHKVFGRLYDRCAANREGVDLGALEAIVKVADYIDECSEMGTEIQMGNRTVDRVFHDSFQRVKAALEKLREHYPMEQRHWYPLESTVIESCLRSRDGESRSTRIFETL